MQTSARLAERRISLQLSDAAAKFIAEASYDATYGARPVKRYLQRCLETPLSRAIIAGEILDDSKVEVDVHGGSLIFRVNGKEMPAGSAGKPKAEEEENEQHVVH